MKFAIIAAGDGSRLAQEGVEVRKPLVRLNGEMMIERLIRIFINQGATGIAVIINSKMPEVADYMQKKQKEMVDSSCPIDLVIKSTPSSMHSFYELSPYLDGEPFCLTTVDTVFAEQDFSAYISCFKECKADGLMAVTEYIDDEKPLYVATDEEMNITGFYDEQHGCRFISGGIYCLRPKALNVLALCIEKGQSRMRNYQRCLVSEGLKLKAYAFPKILDVDHAGDIGKAEEFLSNQE